MLTFAQNQSIEDLMCTINCPFAHQPMQIRCRLRSQVPLTDQTGRWLDPGSATANDRG